MLRIDSHQHFWKYNPVRDTWITEEMSVIRKDFYPKDIEPNLRSNQIDGCIAIQADESDVENEFLLKFSLEYSFIKGVVGWLDFRNENLSDKLEYYSSNDSMKGFRYILQGHPKRDLMLSPQFLENISLLQQYGYTYDLLIFPDQLVYIKELVKQFPKQKFVLDHLAKPYIKDRKIDQWKKDIEDLSSCSNVFCKLSGMVTEADWKNWKYEDFIPYLDVVSQTFGTERIMFGSDWPVCEVAGGYTRSLDILELYFKNFTEIERDNIFGGNAIAFYNIDKN